MSGESLCRLEAVSKCYRPGGVAVSDLSLEVRVGEVLGLLGPPGAGKSTVLGLLGARLRPSAGRIWRAKGGARRLILLDEPLAPPSREAVQWSGGAVVVATGSTALARRLCDRVVLLDRGRSPGWLPAEALAPWVSRTWYRIRLQGHLTERTLQWIEELGSTTAPGGQTVLTGPLPDTAALYGVLRRIERLNLPLLEVAAIDPVEELIRQYATASQVRGPG